MIELYDTTLRDGAQGKGISFSVTNKLYLVQKLDELGIHFIEGGWPSSNPKDAEFFTRAKKLKLKTAQLVAFGSTRRAENTVENDKNIKTLISAGTAVVTVVGKASEPQVIRVLGTSLTENLNMVTDSVRYLKSRGLKVFFDAEHFFDGFKANTKYSLKVLEATVEAGADYLVLCDTNGGSLPEEITSIINTVKKTISAPLGIHAHNDAELAVANTLAAVKAGTTQIQGTINGYGERCGNANLCSIIPNLKLKMGINCITDEQLAKLTEIAHCVSETANLSPSAFLPYVGTDAFSHKGGIHVNAVRKWKDSYQHIDPEKVGNQLKVTVSELSGKDNIKYKILELGLVLPTSDEKIIELLEKIKLLENKGFQYDNADASLELLIRRAITDYKPPFELVNFMVITEQKGDPLTNLSKATVKIKAGAEIVHTAAEGNGPVSALDQALRKGLLRFYPDLEQVKLVDYKVRILEESIGTGSKVRVLIESSDNVNTWRSIGASTNIIEASWIALADSLEYWLIKRMK